MDLHSMHMQMESAGSDDDITDEKAAHIVVNLLWTRCNQHGCPEDISSCKDVNHRRDIDLLRECLQSVGIV